MLSTILFCYYISLPHLLQNENLLKILIGNGKFSNTYMTRAVVHEHTITTLQQFNTQQKVLQ
jgi:hypothetical protein